MLLDTDLLERAARELGTERASDTVREALGRVARREHLRNLLDWELPDDADQALAEQRSPRRA